MDEVTDHQRAVMRRAGLVLVVIGLLDIAWCAVAVARGQNYSSSLNVFALAAGALVYRGSARAARFVMNGLSFLLGGVLLLPLLLPLFMPARLLWLELRLSPLWLLQAVATYVVVAGLLYWVRELLADIPIHGGGTRATPLYRSVPAALGAGIALLLAIVLPLFLHGAAGQRAVTEAERKVGPGYSFWVQRLDVSRSGGSAVVVAYTDTEVREVAVEWRDE